jgi:hypothetical protein
MQVEQADLRPTGPEQRSLLARTWQHRLNRRLGTHDTPQDQQCLELFAEQSPKLIKDSFLPSLTKTLENLDRAGPRHKQSRSIGSRQSTATDDHPAAALWWRILDELPQPLPDNSHQTTPAVPRLNATKPRREPHRAPQTPPSTIRPNR